MNIQKNVLYKFFAVIFVICLVFFSVAKAQKTSNEVETKVKNLLEQLTLDEKISLISGTGFDTVEIKRLGIPALHMTDGPVGVRIGPATSFPSGIAFAATFDPKIIYSVGKAIAQEAKAKDFNVLLGPAMDIQRVPYAGRNFESYGEDPFLAAQMAVGYIRRNSDGKCRRRRQTFRRE